MGWLRFLDKSLNCAKKSDVKECQKKLVEQLMAQLVTGSPGPPTRQLLAQCMATLFSVGDTFLLFDTINKCNDLLKTKDDSPTFLPCRLAATVVVGAMYQKLGRMMGRSYEETVSILTKGLKNAESLTRAEKMELDVTGSANIGLGPANATSSGDPEEINRSRFNLLLGVSMEALCSPRTGELTSSQLNNCLGALASLLESVWARVQLTREEGVLVELCNVLHRQLLSQDNTAKQEKILEVVSLAVKSATENLANKKKTKLKELFPANQSFTDIPAEVAGMGEGGETGKIKPGKSMSFAILEVCLCVLVRYFPDISPRAAQSSSVIAMQARSRARSNRGSALSPDQQSLISAAVSILAQVPGLCSPQGTITIIPTVLYLITGTLKESAIKPWEETEILAETAPVVSCLSALQTLVSMRYTSFPEVESRYFTIMQSGLLRVLDLAKTAPQEAKLDEVSL